MIYLNEKDIKTGEQLVIRNETKADQREVENMTWLAFWNLYVPGCVEHYVAHQIRQHPDFIEKLDLVLTLGERIVGNIMYTRATLMDESGRAKTVLTFGPLSVRPGYQRRGYGKRLINTSFQIARSLGFDTVVIFGMPANYVARGFRGCAEFQVSLPNGQFPTAMLVKELVSGVLKGHQWQYLESPAMEIDEAAAEKFDQRFPSREKGWQPSQAEFQIISQSFVQQSK